MDLIDVQGVELFQDFVIFGAVYVNSILQTFTASNDFGRIGRKASFEDDVRPAALYESSEGGSIDGVSAKRPGCCIDEVVAVVVSEAVVVGFR